MADQAATAPKQLPLRTARMKIAVDEIYTPRRPPSSTIWPHLQKVHLWDMAASMIGAAKPMTYLEFGVWKGDSIAYMAWKFPHSESKFFGFDSFEGLPEAWGNMMPGHFALEETPIPRNSRTTFVKGYFQNTVPGFLTENRLSGPLLVHFDADLYSSTLFLLTTLWHHIPEYYFLFDEFVADEVIALHDFASAYPIEVEFFGAVEHEDAPLQTFGRLRNTVLTVDR